MTKEPDIIINGQILSEGEAKTIRVAIQAFAMSLQSGGLGKDEMFQDVCAGYLANIDQINLLIVGGKA